MGVIDRIRGLYGKSEPEPLISTNAAIALSIACTLFYVVPLYLSPASRPSPTLSRDALSVIKYRVRAVMTSCFICSLGTFLYISSNGGSTHLEALRLLGWWPIGASEIFRSLLLTALLFIGLLFEKGLAEGEWRNWIQPRYLYECFTDWIGWRNYVAGPITEEVTFRSIIIALHLLAKISPVRIVFLSPLYFGIAHVHHFYEFKLTHAYAPLGPMLFRTVFQFTYTTIFGWFAAFVYLRTGSLFAAIFVHSFCNCCGLPRLWGRVQVELPVQTAVIRGKEDENLPSEQLEQMQLGIGWTITYYVLLVIGAIAFWKQLWPMTESPHALVSFTRKV